MEKLYFITGNEGKFLEVSKILENTVKVKRKDIDLPEIQEIDPHKIIKDKLERAKECYDGEFIVEDTSLYLEALGGLPGPLIKWFLETIGNEGLFDLCERKKIYGAEARTVIGYLGKDGEIRFFEGIVKGNVCKPRGENGFGWGFIFEPVGHSKTFAEMESNEKNEISMRRLALDKLKNYLESLEI